MGRDAQYGFWTANRLGDAAPTLGAHIGFKGVGWTTMSEKYDRCSCVTVHLKSPFSFPGRPLPPVPLQLSKITAHSGKVGTGLVARGLERFRT